MASARVWRIRRFSGRLLVAAVSACLVFVLMAWAFGFGIHDYGFGWLLLVGFATIVCAVASAICLLISFFVR